MSRLFAAMPLVAFAYVLIGQPLLDRLFPGLLNSQAVWPVLFALTLLLAVVRWSDLNLKLFAQPPMLLIGAFLCLTGISYLWAFSPSDSLKRWVQAVIIVGTITIPMAQRKPMPDIIHGLFLCYVASIIINGIFVLSNPPTLAWDGTVLGHAGYFLHKQYLGMCASVALLMTAYFILSGRSRVLALITLCASLWLVFASESKTSLGFAILAPVVASIVLFLSKKSRLPVAFFVSAIPICFMSITVVIPDLAERISFRIYGDSTFTGRVFIWQFIESQTTLNPWLGWGFHSFWFVPYSPIETAPGFVRDMPSSHSGYLDLRLENGYLGLMLFLAFVVATLYSLEHVRRDDPRRAFYILSLFVYILLMNLLETIWLIPFDPLWILFLVLVADTARRAVPIGAPMVAPMAPEQKSIRAHWYPHSTVNTPGESRYIRLERP